MAKKLLGSLSPIYGAATGEGLFGKVGQMGLVGQLGKAYRDDKDKDKDKKNAPAEAMKKGGKVKSKPKAKQGGRGDGCAQRGKTKGRMI